MKKFENFKSGNGSIIMMVGISGSGKGYYIKNKILKDFPKIKEILEKNELNIYDLVVCPDDIRREITGDVSDITKDPYVWTLAKERVNIVLKTYGYCVFDATNVANKTRNNFLKGVKYSKKIAVIFKPDVELSKSRILKDIEEGVDRSKVPMYVIDRQFLNFKKNLIGDENWNGEWNNQTKDKIREHLKNFDEIKFAS